MSKVITVKAESGSPGSLTKPVKIAFAVAPEQMSVPPHPCDPIAASVSSFSANGQESADTSLHSPRAGLGIVCYTAGGQQVWSSHICPLYYGQAMTLTSPNTWTKPALHYNPSVFLIINGSGLTQSVMLGTCLWDVAYHPLLNGCSIAVGLRWKVEAYVVDDTVKAGTIIHSNLLRQSIFPSPILLDALPAQSTWRLSQDEEGRIRINHDEFNPINPAKLVIKKDPLSEILERLSAMERAQEDFAATQRDIQDQLSRFATKEELQKSRTELDRDIAVVGVASSRNHDLLRVTQKTVADTEGLLSGMEKSAVATKDQLQDLNRRVPIVESKAALSDGRLSILEKATLQTQDHVSKVEQTVNRTQDHLSVVQQLVVATDSQLLVLEPGSGSGSGASTATVVTTERHSPSEGDTSGLERSLSQIQEQLSLVKKAVRTMDRRMPAMDAKVDKLESSLTQTQRDLAAVQASLASYDRRITAVEARSRDDAEGAVWSSPEGSPAAFPDQLPPDRPTF